MNVSVNDTNRSVPDMMTLYQLMVDMDMTEKKGIAIALNEKVCPRDRWEITQLKEQDRILIITATQGG